METKFFIHLSNESRESEMKKLYNKKGKIHPTPLVISDHFLTFLPATILTLASALSPQDREVLAYLISCSGTPGNFSKQKKSAQRGVNGGGGAEHSPLFHCNCFLCYTSYWVRWDSSPNRQLIHDIIDAYEDELASQSKKGKNNKKERRKKVSEESVDLKRLDKESVVAERVDSDRVESVEVDEDGVGGDGEVDEEIEKGSVRKIVSFIGERIWGVWG